MRCTLGNAAMMLVILLPCAAAAPAAMVEMHTSQAFDLEPLPRSLPARAEDAWFPDVMPSAAAAVLAPNVSTPPPRSSAILIPLPAPLWIGIAGVGCALAAARVARPRRNLAA